MLKNITKFFVAGTTLIALQPVYSMEIYTVKPGDYLFKIAKSNTVSGVSVGELTDAIKGINKSEVPGIVDNRIQVGNKLAIPTTKDEVEDGLTLSRNSMLQGSYNQQVNTPKEPTSSGSLKAENTRLGDQEMITNQAETKVAQKGISQETIPSMIPEEDSLHVITYKNDLNSPIEEDNVQESEPYDSTSAESSSIGSIFGKIIKFIFSLVILAGLFIAAKKVWDNRNSKKAEEQELISKKKRDHLMSRISPVVSDTDFYKSEDEGPQEAFDFFATKNDTSKPRYQSKDGENYEDDLVGSGETEEQNDLANLHQDAEFDNHGEKNIATKTEKGMVFETASSEKFANVENGVEEIDTSAYEENEMEFVEELIEQYLESEKYIEASITIQDSLEKDQNNINLRYMLLEVYARAGDEIAFEGEVHFIKSKNIVSMFDPLHQKIAKLRDKYFEYS
ncbi:LysM peptidoglycan-binding domain-containing protein [Francisellaceae bacterium CB300]